MTRRITCYVVFVTLLWGAHTDDEEKVRDMFKSNMTRNDFSNLLQSLIKLNEQRVSVLQKLYRLEDYGVLSEVLRSGDKKTGNGNPNNLFLIVMSKNQNDPSRRKIGFQLVDSVSSLNAGSNNNHPKLDFVLDPASYITQNIRKENKLESIFGNFPRVGPTKTHRADYGSKKNNTTKETFKFNKPGLRAEVKYDSNVLRAVTSLKANENRKYNKENGRYEIINDKRRRPNASEKLLGYDDHSKHPQTVGYNSQSSESVEIDFTIKNEKLTTKPKIIKHIITSNHQNAKYPARGKDEDDYGSPFGHIEIDQNRQYTKIISDISIKKYRDINLYNPETNKYTPKVKVQSNQQKDKLTIKPILRDILSSNYKNTKYPLEGTLFSHNKNDHNRQYTKIISDISIKKYRDINLYNPETNKYTPKVKVQSNQQKDKLTIKPILRDILSSNYKNTKYPLEGTLFSHNKNDHNGQYTKMISDISIKTLHGNNHKTNKYIPKVKVQSNQQKDKLTTKLILIKDREREKRKDPLEGKDGEDKYFSFGSPLRNSENGHNNQHTKMDSDISVEKLHDNNHHNPKINKYTPKVKVQSKQQNDKLTNKPIIIKDILSRNHKNVKYPLEGKDTQVEDAYGSPFSNIETNRNRQYTIIISDIANKKHHYNNHKTSKYTPKVKVQSKQQNEKLTTKQIIIKDIITSNRQNPKYPLEGKDKDDYGSPFTNIEIDHYSQYGNVNSNIPKLHVNKHQKLRINKIAPNVKVQSNQQNDKLTIKPITIKDIITSYHPITKYPLEGKDALDEDGYSSPFSHIENDHYSKYTNKNIDISIKKLHVNYHNNPKTIENTSRVNNQRNQHPKLNQNKSNINNQDNKYSKIKAVKTSIYQNAINGTVKNASENNQVIKNPSLNNDNTNVNNEDLTFTSIKYEYATRDTKLPLLASENVYGSKPVPVITKDTQYGSYPDFENHKDVTDNSNKDKPETVKDTLYGNYPDFEDHKDVTDNSNKDKLVTVKDTLYGNYPDFEDHKDVRDNSNKDKPKASKDTPFENDPGFENIKVVTYNTNKDKLETTIGTPFGIHFHGFEHHKNVMTNLNKDKPKTVTKLRHKDNPNVKSIKDPDYYGVKMVENGKSAEEFSVFITSVGNKTAEEVKQQNDRPRSKHIARKPFAKCLNKKALKLCSKSCISGYKNVCRRLKCTSRSKKALKSECKRSCKKTFKSSSGKYSDENSSSDEYSDESDSDYR